MKKTTRILIVAQQEEAMRKVIEERFYKRLEVTFEKINDEAYNDFVWADVSYDDKHINDLFMLGQFFAIKTFSFIN